MVKFNGELFFFIYYIVNQFYDILLAVKSILVFIKKNKE